MYPLKQSTALDVVFFAHDVNGDPVTGKVDGNWTKRVSKAGAAFAAMTVTVTEREGGWYHAQLSTSHTDTLGVLTLFFSASGVKQVNLQFRVTATLTDDLSARLPAALVSGRIDASTGAMAAGVLTASAIAADAITAAKVASDVGDEIRATLATASSQVVIQGNIADLQARLPAALIDGRLDVTVGAMQANVLTSASLASTAVAKIWDEVLEGTVTARQLLRGVLSAVALKLSGAATTTIRTRNVADNKDRLTVTCDANGNRTAVTMDLS